MRLVTKSFMLTIEEVVQIGELKVTMAAQVFGNKDQFDIELGDLPSITYMGIEIDGWQNWKKFRDFHKEMGIDYQALINKKFEEVFAEEAVKKLVAKVTF